MSEPQQQPEPQPEPGEGTQLGLEMPREMFGGVWANFAIVAHSEYEFTIDFIRLDRNAKRGVVTSRVNLSPLFVTQLLDALQTNWDLYAKKALPKEIQ